MADANNLNSNSSINTTSISNGNGVSANNNTDPANNIINNNNDQQSNGSWQNISPSKSDKSTPSNEAYVNVVNNDNDNDDDDDIIYNLDTSLSHKSIGNNYYKLKLYDSALNEYNLAIKYCPQNNNKYLSIFYGNRAAVYLCICEYELAISDCNISIQNNDKYIKAYWRRAKSYEKLNKYYEAKCDYNKICEIDPNNEISIKNIERIEPLVKKQFEQQKDEVIGKLKGFANWGLGKIGLSLNNFETKQDPNTGAYNIQFNQNKQ